MASRAPKRTTALLPSQANRNPLRSATRRVTPRITQHRVMLGSAAPHSVASWRLRANTPPGGAGAVRGRGASAPHVPDAVALRAIGAKIRRATMTDGSFACAGIIGRARFKKR